MMNVAIEREDSLQFRLKRAGPLRDSQLPQDLPQHQRRLVPSYTSMSSESTSLLLTKEGKAGQK